MKSYKKCGICLKAMAYSLQDQLNRIKGILGLTKFEVNKEMCDIFENLFNVAEYTQEQHAEGDTYISLCDAFLTIKDDMHPIIKRIIFEKIIEQIETFINKSAVDNNITGLSMSPSDLVVQLKNTTVMLHLTFQTHLCEIKMNKKESNVYLNIEHTNNGEDYNYYLAKLNEGTWVILKSSYKKYKENADTIQNTQDDEDDDETILKEIDTDLANHKHAIDILVQIVKTDEPQDGGGKKKKKFLAWYVKNTIYHQTCPLKKHTSTCQTHIVNKNWLNMPS